MHYFTLQALLVTMLLCISAASELLIKDATVLEEVDRSKDIVVDGLWSQNSNTLFISKAGARSETLGYDVTFENQSVRLVHQQRFEKSAPILIESRDYVMALRTAGRDLPAVLFRLNKANNRFENYFAFRHNIQTIASTRQSNFVATINYQRHEDFPALAPALRLFTTAQTELTQASKAIGIAPIKAPPQRGELKKSNPSVTVSGIVTAIAMSPLKRERDGNKEPHNRVVALAHSMPSSHSLHLWYFPSIESDFNNAQGHIVIPFNNSIDTVVFSPNTFGLVLVTNKTLGKVWVLKLDLKEKAITKLNELTIEKSLSNRATHVAAAFGPNDEIVLGINQTLYLFKARRDGIYRQADIQPVRDEIIAGEHFSAIVTKNKTFIAVGTRGGLQFGEIE